MLIFIARMRTDRRYGLPMSELISEGNGGGQPLRSGARLRFATYAIWWIKAAAATNKAE